MHPTISKIHHFSWRGGGVKIFKNVPNCWGFFALICLNSVKNIIFHIFFSKEDQNFGFTADSNSQLINNDLLNFLTTVFQLCFIYQRLPTYIKLQSDYSKSWESEAFQPSQIDLSNFFSQFDTIRTHKLTFSTTSHVFNLLEKN